MFRERGVRHFRTIYPQLHLYIENKALWLIDSTQESSVEGRGDARSRKHSLEVGFVPQARESMARISDRKRNRSDATRRTKGPCLLLEFF